ncbi:unnamed protein product [Mortierella alpina]
MADIRHRKLNPLDLPEIIARIGQFLPLWSGEGFQREFDPRPLLRCSLVSRSFRAALLPTLWYLYDGYRMRNIPQHILIKYSPYFRIITSTGPFKGPFRCRNLIELSTVYGQEWSRDLLVSNPGLKRLVWGGPFHRRIETLEQQQEWELELKALLGLENLDEFRTTGFSLGEGIFVKVLRNNAARLSNLALSTVAGVTSIKGLELPHLTELHVTLGCVESPALVDLLRCCPRLQRLSLMGSMAKGSSSPPPPPPAHVHQEHNPANIDNQTNTILHSNSAIVNDHSLRDHEISRLAQNIAECCPELSSVKFTTSSQSSLVPMHRNHSSQLFLTGSECAALVNATSRLESFSAELMTLDYTLTEALVAQASSFKSLQLTFRRTDSELSLEPMTNEESRIREVHCLRRLKASLYRLKDLSLTWDERHTTAAISALGLFQESTALGMTVELRKELVAFLEEPWATSQSQSQQGLESLAIRGLFPTTTSVVSQSIEGSSSATLSESVGCWRPLKAMETNENRPVSMELQDGDAMLRLLLSSLDTQIHLECLTVNRTVYERHSGEQVL